MTTKPKATLTLKSPYIEVAWPTVTPNDQRAILEILLRVLNPIGEYRRRYNIPSKGKRAKKKKAQHAKAKAHRNVMVDAASPGPSSCNIPPEISKQVTIGFNSTVRYLETLAGRSALKTSKLSGVLTSTPITDQSKPSAEEWSSLKPLAAIFVSGAYRSSRLFAQIAVLVNFVTSHVPTSLATRLVPLPQDAEMELSNALNVARVGMIGLGDEGFEASEIIEFIRARVLPVEVPWLDQIIAGVYLPLQVSTDEAHQARQKRPLEGDDAQN